MSVGSPGHINWATLGPMLFQNSTIPITAWTMCHGLRTCKTGPMLTSMFPTLGYLGFRWHPQPKLKMSAGDPRTWRSHLEVTPTAQWDKGAIPKAAHFPPHSPLELVYSYGRIRPQGSTSPSTHFKSFFQIVCPLLFSLICLYFVYEIERNLTPYFCYRINYAKGFKRDSSWLSELFTRFRLSSEEVILYQVVYVVTLAMWIIFVSTVAIS